MDEQQNQQEEKNINAEQTALIEALNQQKHLQEKFYILARHHKHVATMVFYLIVCVLILGLGIFILADYFSANSNIRLRYNLLEKLDSIKLRNDSINLNR